MTHSVLFIDDDETILAAFRRMFRKTFDITTLSNAVQALKLINGIGMSLDIAAPKAAPAL